MKSNQSAPAIGLALVVVVVIANIIGSGVYKKVAPMAVELQSPAWVLLCWALAGMITLFGALSNAEVAGLLADTGGEYAYFKKIYNRFFAFIFGWSVFTVMQTASIASISYVFAQSLHSMFPMPALLSDWASFDILGIFTPFADFHIKLIAIVLIILLTWLNMKGIQAGAWVSSAILAFVFSAIFLIVVFGLSSPQADIGQSVSLQTTNNAPITISAIFTAMLAAFWAYQGWAAVGYVGGEIKNAQRNIPRGIAIGIFTIITTYLLVNITYLSLLSVEQLTALHKAGNQIAAVEAVRSFWGSYGVVFISVLILVTTLGCTNATILSSSRMYYAMAREGMFFRQVAHLNKHHAPAASLTYQCIWACILILSGTFDQLTDMIIFANFIYYGATTLGVFILRYKMPDAPRPYRVWGYPIVPAIFIIFCLLFLANTIYSRPREAGIGLVLILTGVPMYVWFNRKK
jgi:APA family basic amino acid/polyamine antiporter